ALQSDERAWEQWVVRVHRWHERWQVRGITPALRSVFDVCEVPGRLLAWVDGERRMTNLLHLGELLQRAAVEGRRGPLALAEWLGEMRHDAHQPGIVGEAAQIRLESDDDAVRLLTIHKSKGLEFPIVICPFVWDGGLLHEGDKRFPLCHDPRDGGRRIVDVGSPDLAAHRAAAIEEVRAERLRLLYVALTRARHHCSVIWQMTGTASDAAFAYLVHRPAGETSGSVHAAVIAHLAASSEDRLRQDLDAFAARAGGAIGVRDIAAEPIVRRAARPAEPEPLRVRAVQRRLDLRWRTSSFSGLVAAAGDRLPIPVEEGRDRDESATEDAPAALDALHEFPGGARSGLMVHHLFEVLNDGVLGDAAALRRLIGATLQTYGVEPQWSAAVGRTLTDVLDTPLTAAPPFTLRQVGAARRLPEVEFIFPVGAADTAGASLTAARLADVFVRHGRAPLPADYAARLRALPFAPLAGFLKGYIDLVFEHGGRWYLVDYKSNRLGARVDDYQPDRLVPVMVQHHYILQYHLYAVALHRHLQRRLPGYDYERHCGGVYYLFVRGMAPALPPGSGIYHDRPPLALIEALSQALDTPAGDAS
ncbi:MAG: 3'-5' exonuclease, partial [Candidatus Binatia bacterium]